MITRPILCIHGGLSSKKSFNENYKAYQRSMKFIATSGYEYLLNHSAVDTAVYVTKMLEDDPILNAGTGSVIQSDGVIRMSASLMNGKSRVFSGVMNIRKIKNPVEVAKYLQKEQDRVLSDINAEKYARKLGIRSYNPETKARRAEFEKKKKSKIKPKSTVGCVVMDGAGQIAAATSTGGKGWEIPGRVGDSPTVAGNFANNYSAVSCTGVGEDIVSCGVAVSIVTRVTDGRSVEEAGNKSIAELKAINGSAGFIALEKGGRFIAKSTEPYLVWAKISDKGLELFKKE